MWRGVRKPGEEAIHKGCFNITRVAGGRATCRETLSVQWHLKMSITSQVLKNMLDMKITSDTANHLLPRGAVLAKALKGTHTQISANPLAKTGVMGESVLRVSVLPIRHNFGSPKRGHC